MLTTKQKDILYYHFIWHPFIWLFVIKLFFHSFNLAFLWFLDPRLKIFKIYSIPAFIKTLLVEARSISLEVFEFEVESKIIKCQIKRNKNSWNTKKSNKTTKIKWEYSSWKFLSTISALLMQQYLLLEGNDYMMNILVLIFFVSYFSFILYFKMLFVWWPVMLWGQIKVKESKIRILFRHRKPKTYKKISSILHLVQ